MDDFHRRSVLVAIEGSRLVFLLGAVASILGRARRRELVAEAASPTGPASIQAMSWQQFGLLVGEVFRRRGYRVEERGGRGPDGGVDLIARRGGETALVQCKHWRSKQVGVGVVRELLGSMTALGATGGSVATSGRFTAEEHRFAADQGIELIDGEALRSLARRAITSGREQRRRLCSSLRCSTMLLLTPRCWPRHRRALFALER